tara:strand:- start:183 stop:464 length:282 start_codon:yes stop_codon:yes gene_type:complete
MTRIFRKESQTKAKKIFINRDFALYMKGVSNENKLKDIFKECMEKIMWTLIAKNFGAICIKIPDTSINRETYLFRGGPNKKFPLVTNTDSFIF